MEDKETSGKHLMEQEKPCCDGNPEQMVEMTESTKEVESACEEKYEQEDFAPEAQNTPLWKYIVGSVALFIVITFLVIFADVLARKRAEPVLPCHSVPLCHSVPPCPTDWIRSRGMCYYFSKEKRNWTSSQSFCLSQEASLITFNPSLEKDFVMTHKGKAPFWIGLKREPNEPWKWTNGENSTLEIIGEGHCVYLNNQATPVSLRCRTELFWICRKAEAS